MTSKTQRGRRRTAKGHDENPAPLYHQIYMVLRQQLLEGGFDPSEPLPGEPHLAKKFGVARVTIRSTLRKLEEEGLIVRRRGSGTYPVARPMVTALRSNISGLFENLVELGRKTVATPVEYRMLDTPAFLDSSPDRFGRQVLKIVRVRKFAGDPFVHMTSYIPGDIGAKLRRADVGNQPLILALGELGYEPQSAEQVISARAAEADVAALLGVPIGSPLIFMRRLVRDRDGRYMEIGRASCRERV